MNIIIVGCGRVGSRLAMQLFGEGNNVTVIDRNPLAFDKLEGGFEGNMVIGTGIDVEVLVNAGIASTDSVISVAKGDNTNIMVGQIAKFLFKVPKVVVRIVDPKSKNFYEQEIGLTCFCPTETSTQHYISLLKGVDVCTL